MTTLAEYCDITMGQAPDGSTYNTTNAGLPLIAGASDLGERVPHPTRWTTAPTQLCEEGDIVLCIRATIGDRNWADRKYCLGRGVAGLRVKPGKIDSRYLWHWLAAATPRLMHSARGATFLQVNRHDIESLPCEPPRLMNEQRRIADILDKADAIRRKRKEAIALTEELLRSAFLEMFGDPVTNPKASKTKPLGEIAAVHRGRFSPRPRNDPRFYGGAHPFVQTGDISAAPNYLTTWRQTLNESGAKVSRAFPNGSVLVAIVGATIGETAVLAFESYCPDSVVGIVPSPPYTGEFIEYLLRFWKQRFRDLAPETARANINLETLRPVPVPVVEEAAIRRFSLTYRKVATLSAPAIVAPYDTLFASLLQRAFRPDEETT